MPVSDRIRARIRARDCFFAILPDKGFSVLSPMNDKVFPVPGSSNTGKKDIDDGLATLNYNSLATGDAFDFISGRYGARFYANANLSGQTPHHTVIFRAFVTDLTSVDEYPYCYRVGFFFSGGTSYLDHANLTCSIEIDGQRRFYGIKSWACFQGADEFASGNSAARSAGSLSKEYDRAEMSGRWLTVAATVDNETKTHQLFLNGEKVASTKRSTWTEDRNMFSMRDDNKACWLGHSYAMAEQTFLYSKVAWAACFSSVLSPEEIKYLSEE
nr:MAG TPA: Pentaxin family protein [Caudoviricetes sp.]